MAVAADGCTGGDFGIYLSKGKEAIDREIDIEEISRKLACDDRKDDQHFCVASNCDRYSD